MVVLGFIVVGRRNFLLSNYRWINDRWCLRERCMVYDLVLLAHRSIMLLSTSGYYVLCALLLLSAFIAERKDPITIFMIGDSTMANKSLKNGNIERGWGQMLPGYFTEEVVVDNHAMNGRSSLSFINEGRWDIVLSKIHKGDYVFI